MSGTVEEAQAAAREAWGGLEFVDPPETLNVSTNLGPVAYKHKWRLVTIIGNETGDIVAMSFK